MITNPESHNQPSHTGSPLLMDFILDSLPSGLLIFDRQGRILRVNTSAQSILGLPADQAYQTLQDLPEHLAGLRALLQTTEEEQFRAEVAVKLPGASEENTIGYTLKHIDDNASSQVRILIFSDITQILKDRQSLERIQADLFQSQKLAAIGAMISGVVHELNNPLTGISMSTDLARLTLEKMKPMIPGGDPEVLQTKMALALTEIGKVHKACRKAAVLVSDLLTFSRPAQMHTTLETIQDVVEESIQAFKTHPEFSAVKCINNCTLSPITVRCDKVKLEQVFYNLFKNASEAMQRQGTITLRMEIVDQHVSVIVSDEGPGIEEKELSRIFEPFFTSKGNRGVGLGLSISFKTVEQHGGRLSVSSIKGQGTTFYVTLPFQSRQDDGAGQGTEG